LLADAPGWAQKDLGPEDDDTAAVWNSLGMLHRYRGEHWAAFAAYDRALAITAVTCGVDSPDYASVLHNIASLHQTTGNPVDGEEPARRAVAIREAALGPDHPDVATDVGVLGVVVADLGRYDEAAVCDARTRAILTS
jgi:tetratricopeptide (TPR) repeat protein